MQQIEATSMLNLFPKHRKRRSTAANTLDARQAAGRRLRLEAMEGRLMLNGDAPEFTTLDLFTSEFGLAVYHLNAAPQQTFGLGAVEGGFIVPSSALFDVSPDSAGPASPISVNVNVLTPRTTGTAVTGSDLVHFRDDHFYTPAIPPLVIPTIDTDDVAAPAVEQTYAGPASAAASGNQGGAIPIQPILATMGHGRGLEDRSEQLVFKAHNRRSDSSALTRTASRPIPGGEIAGEWARPSMLETAGGEPATIVRPAALPPELSPSLEQDRVPAAANPLSSRAAQAAPRNQHAAQLAESPSHQVGVVAGATNYAIANSGRLRVPVLHPHAEPSIAPLTSPAASHVSSSDLAPSSAYDEVFEQLGTSDTEVAKSLVDGDSWRHTWKATPLLMILAIERLAASNSRRAKQQPLTAQQPVRSRAPDAGDDPNMV
jgi:hypothetical protein